MNSDIKFDVGQLKLEGDKLHLECGEGPNHLTFFPDGSLDVRTSRLSISDQAPDDPQRPMIFLGGNQTQLRNDLLLMTARTLHVDTTSAIELGGGEEVSIRGGELKVNTQHSFDIACHDVHVRGSLEGSKAKGEIQADEVVIGQDKDGRNIGITTSSRGWIRCNAYLMVYNPLVSVQDSEERVALSQSRNDELELNVNGHYKGGTRIYGDVVMSVGSKLFVEVPPLSHGQEPGRFDLLETLNSLQRKITNLENQIAELEARVP